MTLLERKAQRLVPQNIDSSTTDPLTLYLQEIQQTPLLTRQEEVDLCVRIEKGKEASTEFGKNNRRLGPERTEELTHTIEDGHEALDHLIKANQRLVVNYAKKYMYRGIPFLDLINEGNVGLVRATKKFDYKRGNKFSTYASWWIRQAVTRAISEKTHIIRIPVHEGDLINRLLKIQHSLRQELGREPSVEELAKEADMKPKKVAAMLSRRRPLLSLDQPVDEEENSTLGDFIPDKTSPGPENLADKTMLRERLNEVLKELPPREMRILQLRYGLLDGQAYTLEEVGRKMGVTRERIRQIEAQALSRLRRPWIRRKLRD